MIDVFAERPAGDILSRVVRVTLGGQEYALPVRSIRANREWKQQLDAEIAGLINGLDAAGDDYAAILGMLAGQTDALLTMLLSYDESGVLPTREAIEELEPDASVDVLNAVREVWRAANPLVAMTVERVTSLTTPSPPTSSPPPPTAGRRKRSKPD